MNPAPPLAFSILFVVVPIFILAVAVIILFNIIARATGGSSRGNTGLGQSNGGPYSDPMLDPANPLSPMHQATHHPADMQPPPAADGHSHHGGHHHHGSFDRPPSPPDPGQSGGGFDPGGGGHHHH